MYKLYFMSFTAAPSRRFSLEVLTSFKCAMDLGAVQTTTTVVVDEVVDDPLDYNKQPPGTR